MRLTPLLAALSLLALFAVVPSAEARPAPACVEGVSKSCPEFACIDDNLNGKFEWDECVGMACPTWGCCPSSCPPPQYDRSSATCTGYVNVLGSKQRTCVDATQAPECGAWSEGWNMLGYWKSCYGTRALCMPSGCVADPELSTCVPAARLCLA